MDMATHLDREVDDEWLQTQIDAASEALPDALVPEHPDHVPAWSDTTVPEFLSWCNREAHLRASDHAHFAGAFGGPEDRYVGARLLTGWYERNLRIAENLRLVADDTDADRLIIAVGLAHVHVLRHLLGNVPLLCPVTPIPVLAA